MKTLKIEVTFEDAPRVDIPVREPAGPARCAKPAWWRQLSVV
jgi:hypothetical protein